jgi:hypothetical protein
MRRGRLTRCRQGLTARGIETVRWGLPASLDDTPLDRAVGAAIPVAACVGAGETCEIEIVTRPGPARFTRRAECRLVLAMPEAAIEPGLSRRADRVERVDPADVAKVLAAVG